MVSTGDTEISLHIRPKFQFPGMGYSGQVKIENTQNAKICLNFNLGGDGGALWSEIPERGSLENLDTNLLFEVSVQKPACASQIVSHTLRMWRLTNYR